MRRRHLVVTGTTVAALAATALAVPAGASTAPSAAARPPGSLINGSFEKPEIADGAFALSRRVPGWVATVGRIEVDRGAVGPAATGAGAQYVELDSDRASTIEQAVGLGAAGARFTLSFRYAGRPGLSAAENTFTVQIAGTSTTFVVNATSDTEPVWRVGRVPFTADAASGTVRFSCGGPSNGVGPLLDTVAITPVVG